MAGAVPVTTARRLPRPLARAIVAGALRPVLSPRIPIGWQRRIIDLNRHTIPLPPATRRFRMTLGGRAAETVAHAAAATTRTVLYLHGGGYIVGSPTRIARSRRICRPQPGCPCTC